MPHPDDYDYYLNNGCADVSYRLGIQKMPKPYSLMLDADGMFYFWINRETGAESDINWSKWATYRGAKAHSEQPAPTKEEG